ncbi:MAG: L,D-transpeptidase family protein [Bradyrhizobium sp.]|uniref:L,D-transpeptidase family protein n=1 Tax=Bradyrhizobium sp. TaxID=376 RepID=UPI0025BC38DA|nr:L,D-transpeptidase family protein [Bradyrhizobium sp.]MBI5264375.1 L,D-transpeptidase family protein [Bradyrhizobium sp.]
MRDCLKNRAGFDRVLMTVAATFLTVSATSALAQGQVRSSAAELAIEAAIPRPEPANVPPPTINDFKTDTAVSAPEPKTDTPKTADNPDSKPSVATAPATPAPASANPIAPAPEPAKAASNVAPADQPVADRLKDLLAAKNSRYFDRKAERAAADKFYGAREFAPVWTQAGSLTEAAKGVIARLKDAAAEGLNPADYLVPDFAAATTPDALADAELKLTASVLDYARHAQSGRMHWSQVSGDILYPEHPVDPNEVLANVATAKNASAALESYNPPHKLYKELKAKLAQLRGQSDGPVIEIADGPSLKYVPARGKKQAEVVVEDPRVPQLRAKLGISGTADDTRYDAAVAEAVRKFQESAELKPTGILDDRTVKALNSPKRDKQIDIVLVNMERWRWLPRELGAPALGDAYVILNIPDFTLKVMQRGQQVWTTRVVTGKPGGHATPLLSETMKYITVNPTWNVPPSIVYNEYLPALQQDPTVLQRMGLRLEQNRDGSVHISQPPGEANALGRIRFNFPNKFLVYQHDTPDKHLFAKEERAFSHGCMRVQNPDQYASVLLNIILPNDRYTPERIRSMYGRSEIDIKFPTPIPVNITYQTAFVDDAGKLQFRRDIYGRDAIMVALMKNSRGKDLENIVARAGPSYARPATTLPSGVTFANNGGGFSSGPSFFERLFGPPTPPPAPVGRRPQRVFTR